MATETISDEPVVTQIDPNKVVHAPTQTTLAVAATPTKGDPDKPIFNSMAEKLTALLKATPEAPVTEKSKEPPTEAVKPDATGKVDDKDEAGWSSKKAQDWKQLKTRMAEIETKAKNMGELLKTKETEIEQLKKVPVADPKELELLKSERDSLSTKLESVALERSEKFQAHYQGLFDTAIAAAKEAVGPDTNDQERVEHLMQLKPSKHRKEALSEIVAQLPTELDKLNLANAFQEMDRARSERDKQLVNAKDNLQKLQLVEASERTRMADLQKGERRDRVEKVLTLAGNLDAFSRIDGDDGHNNLIAARTERARKALMGELPENELMLMPLLAEEAVHLRENVMPRLIAKLKEMETAITQLSGAQPGGAAHGEPASTTQPDDGSGFIKNFNALYRGPTRKQS